eukprot:TRINITY_DN11579_c0_g4_i2.p1 TRINITY_DN11579_c0_g4~~TRINITY_DN11579_c0_g4_i2.p1  ORF type:complete len:243 (+),score=35.23 TRINITY_DN11579_c0_g4_i2:122-850(+)
MLVRGGSRPACGTQLPFAMLSTRLRLRWKLGEGSLEKTCKICWWQTRFAFERAAASSSVAQFCDSRLTTTFDETVIAVLRAKVRYLLSQFLDFSFTFIHRLGLRTRGTMLPSAFDDCFVQAHVLAYTQRGGPLSIGGRDNRAHTDGRANYLNIIQALTSVHAGKQDECMDLAGQASAVWAIEGRCAGASRSAGAGRKAKKNIPVIIYHEPRQFDDLLEPVDSFPEKNAESGSKAETYQSSSS